MRGVTMVFIEPFLLLFRREKADVEDDEDDKVAILPAVVGFVSTPSPVISKRAAVLTS